MGDCSFGMSLIIKEQIKAVDMIGICVKSAKSETEKDTRFHFTLQVNRSACHTYAYILTGKKHEISASESVYLKSS